MRRYTIPDLIVGIDFGQTCTGVAYNFPARGDKIDSIRSWHNIGSVTRDKVPTLLCYNTSQDVSRPSAWGLAAEEKLAQNTSSYPAEWFKTMLDRDTFSKKRDEWFRGSDITYSTIERWHVDFLREIYDYICKELTFRNPGLVWEDATVEFLFSVPTPWDFEVIERFRALAAKAGFGGRAMHKLKVGLTEPEAVAIHVLKTEGDVFKKGDVVLVTDAGGGTTDLSLVEVKQESVERLKQLERPDGGNIGSVMIDASFQQVAYEWISVAHSRRPLEFEGAAKDQDLRDHAWNMSESRDFQNAKSDFGKIDQTEISIPIKGLSRRYRLERPRVADGVMYFDNAPGIFRSLFDPVVKQLTDQIDKQLWQLAKRQPSVNVAHLVLSGGLGQSEYLAQQVRYRYQHNGNHFPNIADIKIRVAREPQLAVCKGLVADRLSEVRHDHNIMSQRYCRASYGVLCGPQLYDPVRHRRATPELNPEDQRLYVNNAVEWLLMKGSSVSLEEPIIRHFAQAVTAGDMPSFSHYIAVSNDDEPPIQLTSRRHLKRIDGSNLTHSRWTRYVLEHPGLCPRGSRSIEVEYEIRVIIGSMDLQFEIWFDNEKISRDAPIPVEWDDDASIESLSPYTRLLGVPSGSHARPRIELMNSQKPPEENSGCGCCTIM